MKHRWLTTLSLALPLLASAADTEFLPLSGMGETNEAPVYWDFKLDQGRGSGEWQRIIVPSQWEQQGFGAYYYGTQGRGKPDDDPVIPKETGTYRRSFEIPEGWRGRDIILVFEAVMTDTTVTINGQSAGATHQGGFYRFSYDITRLVKRGKNDIEVVVAKESSNPGVNRAERRGDYWTFGGIYRPVWIEARPKHHISWTAIDARADGSFTAQVHFDEPVPRNTSVVAQIYVEGQTDPILREPLRTLASRKEQVTISGKVESPGLWTAETPNLYRVRFELVQGSNTLHQLEQRFGFRTLEVRPNDGVYLNGRKIVLKGINRHSFRPATGRTLTRKQNFDDALLIKSANMNAVRMSHYPPDPAFLEAADEIGLYVLDELAGWQGFYDTPEGARLIGQLVRRDVNHPSILFWDNGNEGGWNTDNDGEFARWDPQRRPVLHPWGVHDGIDTNHYERYDSTTKLSKGPQIFMPTEFLHGLYDGGIGAGLRDFWDVMGKSATVAGGFFWVFADEGIERTDQHGRIDNVGNAAPDGIVGPHHETEGSFYTVKEIWSPVQISDLALDRGQLRMKLRNDYDFLDLGGHVLICRLLRLPEAGAPGAAREVMQSHALMPPVKPGEEREWSLPFSVAIESNEVLELTAYDPGRAQLWTWTLPGARHAETAPATTARIAAQGRSVSAGPWKLEFAANGELLRLEKNGVELGLRGPEVMSYLRDRRQFRANGTRADDVRLAIAPRRERDVIARATWPQGTLRSLTWKLAGDELRLAYELHADGDVDIFGLRFGYPRQVTGKRWVGEGPYRIWKNRIEGTRFGLHEVAINDPVPGESFVYPEFPGFFGDWRWLEMQTGDARVVFRNLSGIPYFGLHRPHPGKLPVIDLPDIGWSFLHVIPPIGNKFDLAETLGPQSQATRLDGMIRGEIAISALPAEMVN